MYLTSLKLKNFRNYKQLAVQFVDQATILVGANAAGKTNLLEAIRFLSLFKSWRASHGLDLVAWGTQVARIEGDIMESGQNHKIAAALVNEGADLPVKRQITLNSSKVSTRSVVGKFLTVLFSPDDLMLVAAAPKERRRYLDIVLGQISPRYYESLQRYQQALEQRNSLFFSPLGVQAKRGEAEIWEAQMAEEGSRLIKERSAFIEAINQRLSFDYREISRDKSDLKISYQPALHLPGIESLVEIKQLQALLQKNWLQSWNRDLVMKQTTLGPHRDDFIFNINGRPLEKSGSRGEWRSAVLSLKLGEKKFIEDQVEKIPVLLLDDVFSELDIFRRATLARRLSGSQCFLTTTDLSSLDKDYINPAKVFQVTGGQLKISQ